MKCETVKCPKCNLTTLLPQYEFAAYNQEVVGEIDGVFYCIHCGNKFSVTATLKIDEIYAFNIAEENK